MRIPSVVLRLIESFERLPGIGPKTAQRLTFYLLHVPQIELENFDDMDVPFFKVHVPRKRLLNNLAKVLGLDYYIMAGK